MFKPATQQAEILRSVPNTMNAASESRIESGNDNDETDTSFEFGAERDLFVATMEQLMDVARQRRADGDLPDGVSYFEQYVEPGAFRLDAAPSRSADVDALHGDFWIIDYRAAHRQRSPLEPTLEIHRLYVDDSEGESALTRDSIAVFPNGWARAMTEIPQTASSKGINWERDTEFLQDPELLHEMAAMFGETLEHLGFDLAAPEDD